MLTKNHFISGTTLILTDPRFNVELDKQTSTYTLRIEDIQETDGAIYQCQVIIALTDKEVADVPLIVRRPPIISDNSTRSVVVFEGQKVQLKCYASGYPPPEIYWRRQDNAVLPTNTSIFKVHKIYTNPHIILDREVVKSLQRRELKHGQLCCFLTFWRKLRLL